jgi:hypothetical protein
MRKSRGAVLISLLSFALLQTPAIAAVKAGTACSPLGKTTTVSNIKYTCVKSGKKTVWNKGVTLPKPSTKPTASPSVASQPAPAAHAPIAVELTFQNISSNIKNVAFTAWSKGSQLIASSKSKVGNSKLFTGPHTPTYYKDYLHPLSQVSRLFPTYAEPANILIIRYNYSDLDWAEETAKANLSEGDYKQIAQNQDGSLAKSNCDIAKQICSGSFQQTGPSGLAVIMQGVQNEIPKNDVLSQLSFTSGELEGHEYFHSLQRIPIMKTGVSDWPHAWWREGSSNWVGAMSAYADNYQKFSEYLKLYCDSTCKKLTEKEIENFLLLQTDNNVPDGYEGFLVYELGFYAIDALVAINGVNVLIDMYSQMETGKSFDQSFANLFGTEWKQAAPLIASVIYAQIHATV